MVYMVSGGRVMRVHGPFVSDEEIEGVTGLLKEKSRPQYGGIHDVDLDDAGHAESSSSSGSNDVYQQAVAIVLRNRQCALLCFGWQWHGLLFIWYSV